MRSSGHLATPVSKRRYTGPVTLRRLFHTGASAALVALFAATATAETPNQLTPEQAAEAAGAARQAAQRAVEAADQIADAALPGMKTEKASKDPLQRARQGVVLLERAGKVLGVGTVLDRDGRILTALSSVSHGNNVDARFADGSVMNLKMGHTDRAWDLALLVPQNGRWKKGLRASKLSATKAGSMLRAFRTVGNKAISPSRVIVKGLKTLQGRDSELLPDAVELGSRFKPTDVGSPIVDAKGNVVAMVARACAPTKTEGKCKRVPYGVPVSAVKAFLRTVPRDAVAPAPWLGIQGVADDVGPVRGVRVLSVHPRSPAGAAGLKGGRDKSAADVVVGVNNVPVTSPEALAEAINTRAVGDTVDLLLYGAGRFRQVTVTLRATPDSPKRSVKRLRTRAGKARIKKRRPRPLGY